MAEGHRQNIPEAVNSLARRIRELRKSESLTQEELAARAGMSVSFLSMIERGDRVPHLESLMKLAAALGVSLAEMFLGVGKSAKADGSPLRPLIEYLERQELDTHEVEVLLIIAKALYEHKR